MTVAACLLVLCAVLLAARGNIAAANAAARRLPRPRGDPGAPATPAGRPWPANPLRPAWWVAAAALIAFAVGVDAALMTTLLLISLAIRAARTARRARAARDANARALPELCRVVAAELRAGVAPADALGMAAQTCPPELAAVLRSAATADRFGVSTAATLLASSPDSGWPLAVCWQVCVETGAALGVVLDRLAHALTAELEVRDTIDAELAGVRLSGAVMACLPLMGLALGGALGADTVGFLLWSAPGRGCLLAAVILDLAGLFWVRALAARALR